MKKFFLAAILLSVMMILPTVYAFSILDLFKGWGLFSTTTYIVYHPTTIVDSAGCTFSQINCPSNSGYSYCVYNFTASFSINYATPCSVVNPGTLQPGQSICPTYATNGYAGSVRCQLWGMTQYIQTVTQTEPVTATINVAQSFSFSTKDLIKIPVTVSGIPDNTLITGTVAGITRSAAVSGGQTSLEGFGSLPFGTYAMTISGGGANQVSTIIVINNVFAGLSLSPYNSLTQPTSQPIQFSLLVQDANRNGLSLQRGEVTLTGSATYYDGTSALASGSYLSFSELGNGQYTVSFNAKQQTGTVYLTVSASKTGYVPQSVNSSVNAIVPGIYVDVSSIPSGAEPGQSMTISFKTLTGQTGLPVDADDITVSVVNPLTTYTDIFSFTNGRLQHTGTGSYSFYYTFSSQQNMIELYRISITASAITKGYGTSTSIAGISVYPGNTQTITDTQTTTTTTPIACSGFFCGYTPLYVFGAIGVLFTIASFLMNTKR